MFETAYIAFIADDRLPYGVNKFSMDNSASHSISGVADIYKIKHGEHTIVINSGNGHAWRITENIPYDKIMNIYLRLEGNNIAGVSHALEKARGPLSLVAKKLK